MPIYEYRCKACGHELEKLQKISDDPLTDCPACGQPELSKLISAAGFRLKGGGWYETDFKKDKKKNLAGEKDAKGADSKTESKPDSKPTAEKAA
jgi:putative FmdB family regulatory protein